MIYLRCAVFVIQPVQSVQKGQKTNQPTNTHTMTTRTFKTSHSIMFLKVNANHFTWVRAFWVCHLIDDDFQCSIPRFVGSFFAAQLLHSHHHNSIVVSCIFGSFIWAFNGLEMFAMITNAMWISNGMMVCVCVVRIYDIQLCRYFMRTNSLTLEFEKSTTLWIYRHFLMLL